MTGESARRAAEASARASYGRLLALLVARGAGLADAEDALGDALGAALMSWPVKGAPANPDAWLLVAARRALGHGRARRATRDGGTATLALIADERADTDPDTLPDRRLALLFACAHPAIDPALQPALMLQVVLGLDAARIAAAFLVSPAAMERRLSRGKAKIRDAGIPFAIPPADALAGRVDGVLAAVYAAYGTAWEDIAGADMRNRGLAEEAIWLARVACAALPDHAEAKGLLATMLYAEARGAARRDDSGAFVPLDRQDVTRWDAVRIAEAEALLCAAAHLGRPGRFQTEAAIQSLHIDAARRGARPPGASPLLYDALAGFAPTPGVLVARAAAYAADGQPADALAQLDAIALDCRSYQPWWAVRADALARIGDGAAAHDARATAAALTTDPAIRAFLQNR